MKGGLVPPFFFRVGVLWLVSSCLSPLSALTGYYSVINLIRALLALLVALVAAPAFADAPIFVYAAYGTTTYNYPDDINGACAASHTDNYNNWSGRPAVGSTQGYCVAQKTFGDFTYSNFQLNAITRCVYGTLDDSKAWLYKCPTPPPPQCPSTDNVPPLNPTVGWATGPDVGSAAVYLFRNAIDGDQTKPLFLQQKFCVAGCVQQPRGYGTHSYQEIQPSENGYYRIFFQDTPMTQTGGACTVSNVAGQPVDPAQPGTAPKVANTFNGTCPTGSVPGGQDSSGITICVGKPTQPASSSSTTTKAPTTTSTDASGNTVTTDSTTQTNADGSRTTVTTTTTTAPDGTKTISVSSNTTAATSGAPGTTDPKPDDQPNDMCKLHPELTVCRNSQVLGACEAVTCVGDAIQCATLRAAATMQCQQQRDLDALKADPNSALGSAVASGNDPRAADIANLVKGDSVDMSSTKLDQSGWLNGGACLAPITFQVAGRSFVASFDAVCSSILPIRAAIMLMAFIISYLLVSRSILQS